MNGTFVEKAQILNTNPSKYGTEDILSEHENVYFRYKDNPSKFQPGTYRNPASHLKVLAYFVSSLKKENVFFGYRFSLKNPEEINLSDRIRLGVHSKDQKKGTFVVTDVGLADYPYICCVGTEQECAEDEDEDIVFDIVPNDTADANEK